MYIYIYIFFDVDDYLHLDTHVRLSKFNAYMYTRACAYIYIHI